jgi:membrane protein implicated in regulation of membrane protease activity
MQMQWWAWVAVGAILLGSELAFVDAQFYLVFVGAAALVVGFLSLSGLVAAPWLQWLIFAALAVFSMLTFRRRIYEQLRSKLPVVQDGLVGQQVTLPAALAPGATTRLEYRGSSWNAINAGTAAIAAGTAAKVERIDGLTLVLRNDS